MNIETIELLNEWSKVSAELTSLKSKESRLRKELFEKLFPDYEPGSKNQKLDLDARWKIQGEQKLNYSIDQAALPSILEQLPEGIESTLVRYKPEIVMTNYKKLPQDQRLVFDQALVIKPATPTLKLIPSKE